MPSRSSLAVGTTAAVLLMGALTVGAQQTGSADASKTANPELVGELAQELKVTPQQAEGAAGALFAVAKDRLAAGDWAKVDKAVPGMNGLLKAAPAMSSSSAAAKAVTGVAKSGEAAKGTGAAKAAGGLASAAAAFSKLGLKPEMASAAVPVLTRYVSKMGGADVGSLLAGALK